MDGESLRLAEVIGALSLATDLGMGDPLENGLRSTLVAMTLAERMDADAQTLRRVYFGSLLYFIGCTAEGHVFANFFGDEFAARGKIRTSVFGKPSEMMKVMMRGLGADQSGIRRFGAVMRAIPTLMPEMKQISAGHCEVARMLAPRLGLGAECDVLWPALYERWDGKGLPGVLRKEQIPLPVMIVTCARDATMWHEIAGTAGAAEKIRSRGGLAYAPDVADAFAANADECCKALEAPSAWDAVMDAEPGPRSLLKGEQIDAAFEAIGEFADLKTPWTLGHSGGVSRLAAAAAERVRLDAGAVTRTRRAASIHDTGRIAVSALVWNKPGALTADEQEKMRLHPYHAERVLTRSEPLAAIARLGSMHHERLDGSGYYRALDASSIPVESRIIAAADAYHAMTQARPHRPALTPESAATMLREETKAGRYDADATEAVLAAAGHAAAARGSVSRPGGLTEREAEVLRLLAHGQATKQVARALGISPKTAGNHIQSIYAKIGVSTRAGAALYAARNGLAV